MKCSILLRALLFVLMPVYAFGQASSGQSVFKEEVAAGPSEFTEVRHVVLRGSNYEIGRQIAMLAKKNHHASPLPASDPAKARVQRDYIKKNYPILYERMRGVADGFGRDINDDACDFSQLGYGMMQYGCSAVFYPANFTETGKNILSRNFEFTTGSISGLRTKPGETAAAGRPYVFEVYPDKGYASLYICSFDLLGGTIDGVNSEGLTVAILADNNGLNPLSEPARGVEVGLNELLVTRYLLDNCKNTDEAKEALLGLKQFYTFAPLHYIIADRRGKSFIYELGVSRNVSHITTGTGIQCVTNHLLYPYKSLEEMQKEGNSYDRYKSLVEQTGAKKIFAVDEIKQISHSVAADNYYQNDPAVAPGRTLWHVLYCPDESAMEVRFYLGEKTGETQNDATEFQRTEYLKFKL